MNSTKLNAIFLLLCVLVLFVACDSVRSTELIEDPSEMSMTATYLTETSSPIQSPTPPANSTPNVNEQLSTSTGESLKQLKIFQQSFPRLFPPSKIEYDPEIWEYRNLDPTNFRTFKALFSKQYPSCYFNYGVQPHSNYEPAEFINLDGRNFLSRRELTSLNILDEEREVIVYAFTYPGIEGIENTPVPRGRYGGNWKFLLIADPKEIEGCYLLTMDLLRRFEPQLEPVATQMSNPYATLHFYVGNQDGYKLSFSYFDSEWVDVNEGNPNPILVSRNIPECSFEGYNQGVAPDINGWNEFLVYNEPYFWISEPNLNGRPDTRIILYTPTLKTWMFEVYTPTEFLDECMRATKGLLEHRELTPLVP